ncbi:MAG TPA: APH(3') family aminoglycoside O-phosphotransferase [Candidatus Kapabacteria bacterium]|nr:APH(3') family aminoglycoside O-phosphotransferase [Candidatus Kapabacteria bacterium]
MDATLLPAELAGLLNDAAIERRPDARLGTELYHIQDARAQGYYLKFAPAGSMEDLDAERQRLVWLAGRLPVPEVRGWWSDAGGSYLLISELHGATSSDERWKNQPRRLIERIVEGMRTIHAVPLEDCPFRNTLESELREAKRRIEAGEIDRAGFMADAGGRTPEEVYEDLAARKGMIVENTFTHGDYCMPNIIIDPESIVGFIDWGIAGSADPHRDLMAMADSVSFNLGEEYRALFFEVYGAEQVNHEIIRYYTLLDYYFGHHVVQGTR